MSVRVRPYRGGGWEVDISVLLPNGRRFRERRKATTSSKTAAREWGERRERELLLNGPNITKEVPILAQFVPRVLENAKANRQKPSGIVAKESIFRVHLVPALGQLKLDEITTERVQALKSTLAGLSAKTINNILVTLSGGLRTAVDWGILPTMPCKIRLLPVARGSAGFHDFEEFERLVEAARSEPTALLIVLLGGEAGLRCGEMLALEWADVNLVSGRLSIQRSDWRGNVTTPKSGRSRHIPLTARLEGVLRAARHLRSGRVLCQADGSPLTHRMVAGIVRRAARKAQVARWGVHRLRHTFCSHLAAKGAPAKAIQELAGHSDLLTTQRYMHLSPVAVDGAIRLLNRGEIAETASAIAG